MIDPADTSVADDGHLDESDQVFASAADLFRLLATPIRLKIISALCGHEKNVSQLLGEIETTTPNMSQQPNAHHQVKFSLLRMPNKIKYISCNKLT